MVWTIVPHANSNDGEETETERLTTVGDRPPVDSAVASSLTLRGEGAERATRRPLGHGHVALVGADIVVTRAVVLGGQVGL